MSFNPNTDTNWANVVNALNVQNGAQQPLFLQTLVQFFCLGATTGGITLNAGEIAAAISAAEYTSGIGAGNRNF
jgi:hypothetical protein